MRILLASPRGFCAGVDRAIKIVERLIKKYPSPIYVRHEVVHNKHVVENLKKLGVVFVNELDEIPDGAITVFSAHGVATQVREQAKVKKLQVFDATCPLVTKVHLQVKRFLNQNIPTVLIGHQNHPEVIGTMNQIVGEEKTLVLVENVTQANALLEDHRFDPNHQVGCVSQTTLSLDDTQTIRQALQKNFPKLVTAKKDDICYATQNRQNAIKKMIEKIDLLLVVGSQNSSNSNRLAEIGVKHHVKSHLIDDASFLQPQWLDKVATLGISAGASAPDFLVTELIETIQKLSKQRCEIEIFEYTKEEVNFPLPVTLR